MKKEIKKLSINKKTIANLEQVLMDKVKGGTGSAPGVSIGTRCEKSWCICQ